jgi:hypothetical protein
VVTPKKQVSGEKTKQKVGSKSFDHLLMDKNTSRDLVQMVARGGIEPPTRGFSK